MQSRWVVEALDVLGDGVARHLSGGPRPSVDKFILERREETLGGRVVPTVAAAAHAARDAVGVELPLEVADRVLASAIGMMAEAARWQPSADGHREWPS